MFTSMVSKYSRRQAGISMVELIVFIVIVSVGIVGILAVMNTVARSNADPLMTKQALSIAESLLEEIELQPFTYCDPDDYPAMLTATLPNANPGNCSSAAQVQGLAFMAGELRYGPVFFDNVADYNGFSMATIQDITNTAVAGLGSYSVPAVAISQVGTALGLADNTAALRIDVTVNYGTNSVTLTGYRFRYAPNTVP